MHETCIPEGTYDIKFRKVGGFHSKYTAKYKNAHYGMLWLQDVPGFEYILIHTGNTDEHTSGCLIVGESQQDLDVNFNGMVGSSVTAYKKMYAKVAGVLLQGKKVTIEYSKINLDGETDSTYFDEYKDIMDKLQEINGNVIKTNAMIKGRLIT
jgi:hypothetical protein